MGKNNTSLQIVSAHNTLNFSTPKIMGILNVTPDSFFDGGKHNSVSKSIEKALEMIEQGADIIDIGGQSTRPNATLLSESEELDRIAIVLQGIRNFNKNILISIDTFYSTVAKETIKLGADIINDISGATMDSNMLDTIAALQVPYILMHIQGTPATMQNHPNYNNIVMDVENFFKNKIEECKTKGIKQIILDVGFGFGKSQEHNYLLLKNLQHFSNFHFPILAGISRKSMIYKPLQLDATKALNGTTALNMVALLNGANLLRVHDVIEAKEVVTLYNLINN